MRIAEITATNIPPINRFEVAALSDLVVLAGANGVGKTRLIEAFLAYFRSFSTGNCHFLIQATERSERNLWQKDALDTSNRQDVELLQKTLQQNRRRRNFTSSILYFESDRSIQKIKPLTFTWDIADPWEESLSWDFAFSGLRNRFQDTLHAIFKKIHSQRNSIAARAVKLRKEGHDSMALNFKNPLRPFKKTFSQLLGPKILEDADIRNQTLRYSMNGNIFDIATLSSGEREVLNIAFDFILRKPSHCIVFFDEPELHLHPELSSKLLSVLRTIGEHNQLFLCTHSPDIISSSLDDSVVIIGPPKDDSTNQAFLVRQDDETNAALRSLGHSVGVVSLGRRIVLIEGDDGSLDKQTYTHILQNRFSNLVLVPSSGKQSITSFHHIMSQILEKTLWGIDFFMLCDRDAIPISVDGEELSRSSQGKFRVITRYHLENYFLDENVLASVFSEMEPENSWLAFASDIREKLKEIAGTMIPYAAALITAKYFRDIAGNIDIIPRGCHDKSLDELKGLMSSKLESEAERYNTSLQPEKVILYLEQTFSRLERSIENDGEAWKIDIPGKPVFNIFCSKARIELGRLKTLYIKKGLQSNPCPFDEVISIFESFSTI